MRRKTTARRFFSILLNSRLALFAFGVSALGLPFGLLPVSSAIAEEPAKQGRSSNFDKAIADYNEAIRLDPQDVEYTKLRNQALQQKKELKEQRKLLKQQKEKPEPISWWTVFAFALLGFLFVGTGIPLILEKVAPNPWYGFRVQATLENPAVWYPANRYLGKCLLGFGLFVIVTAVGLSFVPDINPGVYFFSCAGALVVGSHVMLILCVLFLQSLSPPHVTRRNISAE
jgi:tetratricopeptide (TPR) repeat protein